MSRDAAMEPSRPDSAEPDPRIAALIDEYFDRRQNGEELTPDAFIKEHPEWTEALQPYLGGLSFVDHIRAVASESSNAAVTPDTTADVPLIEGYELLAELQRGGQGIVYKAIQKATKRIVALKMLVTGKSASAREQRRFDREIELVAGLRHPNIVTLYDSGVTTDSKPYFAMEYIHGLRVDKYLRSPSSTESASDVAGSVEEVFSLFVKICEAVQYAHRQGIVHRDLKPGNILVDADGHPHVLDFGLAKAFGQDVLSGGAVATQTGEFLGTISYAAPEQVKQDPTIVDVRSDVYALGVVLYEALTGRLPYPVGGSLSEVIRNIAEVEPKRPSFYRRRIDDDVDAIVLKALAKEKARRYQSAQEMADDFRRYLEGEPVWAKRPSGFYVLRKKVRKHRWAAGLGTAVVGLGLIGLVFGIRWKQQDLRRARYRALVNQQTLELGAALQVGMSAQNECKRYPGLSEPLLVWAQVAYRIGNPGQAIRTLEESPGPYPSPWARDALLAEIYRATGKPEHAEAIRSRAGREVPSTAEAWYIRSFATLDLHTALRSAQEAVRRDPSYVLGRTRLAELCRITGNLKSALREADELIQLGERVCHWLNFKGWSLATLGKFQQAIEQYSRAIRLCPKQCGLYRHRAHAYRRLARNIKAVEDYTMALQLGGEGTPHVWDLYQRATPLWILGRTDEALEDYRRVRALRGCPSYADARRFLILCEQGRRSGAQHVLDAALDEVDDPSWLRQIFLCLNGELTPAELVAEGVKTKSREKLCEAYYYAGEVDHLLLNRPAEARQWFEKCLQTGVELDPASGNAAPMNEYELAEWRLNTVFADPAATPSEKN